MGNLQTLQQLGVRAKLTLSEPSDPQEREADRLADGFVSGQPPAHSTCTSCTPGTVRRKPAGAGASAASPATAGAPAALHRGRSQPLAGDQRTRLEHYFQTDLSGVRLYNDTSAHRQAKGLGARAFTQGQDIWFGPGQGPSDERLLAHEVAHVVQGHPGVARDPIPDAPTAPASPASPSAGSKAGPASATTGTATAATPPASTQPATTIDAFAARVHARAAERLTRNIAVLDQWRRYVEQMEGFQLRMQLMSSKVQSYAQTAQPYAGRRAWFESFASSQDAAVRGFAETQVDPEASYRGTVTAMMGMLRSKLHGHWSSPSVAQRLQVDTGMRDAASLSASVWVAADPRYDAYRDIMDRVDRGQAGGCETCHELNRARQITIDRWGDPVPGSRPMLGHPLLSAAAPPWQSWHPGSPPAGAEALGDITPGTDETATVPSPFMPTATLPEVVETPPARSNLCGMLPPADMPAIPPLDRWGPGSAAIGEVIRRVGAVLMPLGPRGFRVLPRETFDALYAMTPDSMASVKSGILARIGTRQGDYSKLRGETQGGKVPYAELCPIVDELLPQAAPMVQWRAVQDVREWQMRETLLTVLELVLTALTFSFPPAAVVTVPMGVALGLVRMSLGFDQRRQGQQWSQGIGAGLYSADQEAQAPGLASRGNRNIFWGGFGAVTSGLGSWGMVSRLRTAMAQASLMRALDSGALISHAALPGVWIGKQGNFVLFYNDARQLRAIGRVQEGELVLLAVQGGVGRAGAPAGLALAGRGWQGAGPTGMLPAGSQPFGLLPAGPQPFGLLPARPRPFGALPAGPQPFGLLPAGPRPFGLLPAGDPAEASFAGMLHEVFGSEAGTGTLWQVTPQGQAFPAPPLGGGVWQVTPQGQAFRAPGVARLPVYSPQGVLAPPQWFGTGAAIRVPLLTGPMRPGYTPFDVLPGAGATSQTLNQVRNIRGHNTARGAGAVTWVQQQSGGAVEVTREMPGNLPARRTDNVAPTVAGLMDTEVKNYGGFRGPRGTPMCTVPLNDEMRMELWRDAINMHTSGRQQLWLFTDAPPSDALRQALDDAGIAWMVYSDRLPR